MYSVYKDKIGNKIMSNKAIPLSCLKQKKTWLSGDLKALPDKQTIQTADTNR